MCLPFVIIGRVIILTLLSFSFLLKNILIFIFMEKHIKMIMGCFFQGSVVVVFLSVYTKMYSPGQLCSTTVFKIGITAQISPFTNIELSGNLKIVAGHCLLFPIR